MSLFSSFIEKKSLLIIFAFAPLGLGHLRVTDALYDGLPPTIPTMLLGSQDTSITLLYHFISIYPPLRKIMEWVEGNEIAEELFTRASRLFLSKNTLLLYQQMKTILDESMQPPKIILVIATHFGLAHKLAAIKAALEKEREIKIILIVQVTDDSPLKIWYIPGADYIFVPSLHTKKRLVEYGVKSHLPSSHFIVSAYPVSPLLNTELQPRAFLKRTRQVQKESATKIHVALPISGAAVGIEYTYLLITHLTRLSSRFQFHLVSKNSSYTRAFLGKVKLLTNCNVYASSDDREVIKLYDDLYRNEPISIEVSKPSEQAFKALLDPIKTGGSILLLSQAVGKQEYDNLRFLREHQLLPSQLQTARIFDHFKKNVPLQKTKLFDDAHSWRALQLPQNPYDSAKFIYWGLDVGLFSALMHCKIRHYSNIELHSDGVKDFWEKVDHILQESLIA